MALQSYMEQKPKLLEQVRMVAKARHLSHKTENVYYNFIERVSFSFIINVIPKRWCG
jgi:hypothetical protein